jgi:hypothetical protein
MKNIYKIEYYNKLWKSWIRFDQKEYKTQQSAQERIDGYKEHQTGIKLRLIRTEILN